MTLKVIDAFEVGVDLLDNIFRFVLLGIGLVGAHIRGDADFVEDTHFKGLLFIDADIGVAAESVGVILEAL